MVYILYRNVNFKMTEQSSQTCTWCKGSGYIQRKKVSSPAEIALVDWAIGLGGFILIILTLTILGNTPWAFWALIIVGIVFLLTPLLEMFGMAWMVFWRFSKEPCPHCRKNSG